MLQDVHWSAGLIGYFPTYTLGNLSAAQLFNSANADLPDLEAEIRWVDLADYADGCARRFITTAVCYRGSELMEMATGKPLTVEPLIQSLRTRYLGEFQS